MSGSLGVVAPAAAPEDGNGKAVQEKRGEIYTYEAENPSYAMNWSVRRDKRFRLAVGTFMEQLENKVEIIQLNEQTGRFQCDPKLTFSHLYPPTKIMFIPDKECNHPDILATSGDYLRLWKIGEESVTLHKMLNNNKNSEFCAPLTSFDWNDADPKQLGTSSIDTTCTIWDIERGVVDTQLIAHDKEVYDIAWGGPGVFASVSADGSVRVFDLRDKDHSTIIYESPQPDSPLLRLGWNKQDPRFMATVLLDSSKVVVLDIRLPTLPVAELQRHQAGVNALAWAPHSSCHICTAGDDSQVGTFSDTANCAFHHAGSAVLCQFEERVWLFCFQALIWDLSSMGHSSLGHNCVDTSMDPILAYSAEEEISNLQWCSTQPDWVGITFGSKTQILRV